MKLPCKINDIVWTILTQTDNYEGQQYSSITQIHFRLNMLNNIGKTVFLSKEEAEQALAEMEQSEH